VNEQIKHLIELQQIDSKILNINRLLDNIPLKIAEAESSGKQSEAILDSVRHKLDSLEKKKRTKERHLDDINEKINKLKSRISEIKTNKEYQAHLKEIEAAERELNDAEDAILSIMEEMDSVSRQLKTAESKVIEERKSVEAQKGKLEEEKLEMQKELSNYMEKRSGIVNLLDSELYTLYISLLETHNGIAVTEVRNEICQGCNMNIPPQLFVEIKKNEEIIHCPQCRRILYYKENTG